MSDRPPFFLQKDLSGAAWLKRPETQAVFRALRDRGYEGRAVGGAVRNSLIGKAVSDIDIATTALPSVVVEAAQAAGLAAVPTGIEHGTITVVSNHVPHEVTTLREDVSTDGRRATVKFTTDWARDAARRDFTINALYCDETGRVYDPLGGMADLAAARVRFIGRPEDRIREDYLRILRFFRFTAIYSHGGIDTAGLAACDDERFGLRRLSAERISAEILKLLSAPAVEATVSVMQEHGYWPDLLGLAPSPGRLKRFMEIEKAARVQVNAIDRLAALAVDTDEAARALGTRLRLSRAETHRMQIAARGLGAKFEVQKSETALRRSLYYRGPESYRVNRIFTWLGSSVSTSDIKLRETLTLPERWTPPNMPLTGADVIALGIPPGPRIGQLIAAIERWWIEAGFMPDRVKCIAKLKELSASH